ncbi:cation diffusion facilitator family transporter [Micromonospora sp. NPDC050397]|uniref:cation diffusion facilitator family transporter n=1 Tax=Micromonospora sp. NPDC050397 TaxID=3364279 RepID=UPI00384B12FC
MARSPEGAQSVGTVVIAGAANLTIAAAKVLAGLLSGSAAVLSEAAHSFADTTTEVLLFVALRRGARPADEERPFGHGRESYVWAFLAAVFTFVGGGIFSVTQGVHAIQTDQRQDDNLIAYLVLVISFVAESVSLIRATRQIQGRARRFSVSLGQVVRRTPDTTVKAVFFEDSAALIGLVLAAAGVGLSQLTGSPFWDGLASIMIGVLLLVVAVTLARSNLSLLLGRAAGPATRAEIYDELVRVPTVQRIDTLLTLQLGPDEILVAAKIDFADDATGATIEAAADEAERRLIARNPAVRFVFLDPTGSRAPDNPTGSRAPDNPNAEPD